MAGLPAMTQHEAGRPSRGHNSKLWRSGYFSLPWPTCGGVESDSEGSSAPELDKGYWENVGESESPQARSPSRTPVELGLQRTSTVQSRSIGSNHVSAEPPSHPMMVVIRMEPEPEPIRIRGGGCCGGGMGGGGGARVKVDLGSHSKGPGVSPPTEKPNIHKAPTSAGNDKPGNPTGGTQLGDSMKPTKSTTPANLTKPSSSTKPAKSTKPTKSAKSTKSMHPAQPTSKAVSARISESTPIAQPTDSARTTQPAQLNLTANSPLPGQPTQAAEPVRPAPTSQTAPTAPSIQSTQMPTSTQPIQPGQLIPTTQLTHTAATGGSLPGDSLHSSQVPLPPPQQSGVALEGPPKTGPGLTGPESQLEPAIIAEGVSVLGQSNQKGTPVGTTSQTSEPVPKMPLGTEARRLPTSLPTPPPRPEITSSTPRQGLPQPESNPPIPAPASSSRRRK